MSAPLLVVAIGNASRGDDALGPLLAARLRDEGGFDGDGAEPLEARRSRAAGRQRRGDPIATGLSGKTPVKRVSTCAP